MTTFNLKNLNPGTWFDFKDGGRVCLRVCAGGDLRTIRKQTVTIKKEWKDGKRVIDEDVNTDLQNELIWDFCIVDWEKFFDVEKKPIPCTKENKLLLMDKSIKFSSFIGDCLLKLATANDEAQSEKN
jgi:hypothetical protein